jgi:hypothetical protein
MPENRVDPEIIEPPPFLHTWSNVYTAVVIYLAVMVGGLFILTRLFRY